MQRFVVNLIFIQFDIVYYHGSYSISDRNGSKKTKLASYYLWIN